MEKLDELQEAIGYRFRNLQLLEQALVLTDRFFGKNIDYAATEHSLALICEKQGRREDALERMESAISDLSRILGADHDRVGQWQRELKDMRGSGA